MFPVAGVAAKPKDLLIQPDQAHIVGQGSRLSLPP
jgi:hypothetical protein